jgi:hypothetical protein
LLTITLQLIIPFIIFYSISSRSYRKNIAYAFAILAIAPVLIMFSIGSKQHISNVLGVFLIFANIAIPCGVLFFAFKNDNESDLFDVSKFLFLYATHSRNPRMDVQKIKNGIHPEKTEGYVYGFLDGLLVSNYRQCLEKTWAGSEEFIECLYKDFDYLYKMHPSELSKRLIKLCSEERNECIDSSTLTLVAALSNGNEILEFVLLEPIRKAMKFSADSDSSSDS